MIENDQLNLMPKASVGFFQQVPEITGVFFASLQELPPTHPYTLRRKLCYRNNGESCSYSLPEFKKVLMAFFEELTRGKQ